MDTRHSSLRQASEHDVVITRTIDAPRDLVFAMWTDPRHLSQWWAPKGCTTPFCTVELRPGGRFHYCIRLADGRDIWGLGIYRDIVAPERIVYTDSFADEKGSPVPPTHYGMSEGHPSETLVTVTFEEQPGGTRLTLRHSLPGAFPERTGMNQGWNEMIDRLSAHAASAR